MKAEVQPDDALKSSSECFLSGSAYKQGIWRERMRQGFPPSSQGCVAVLAPVLVFADPYWS